MKSFKEYPVFVWNWMNGAWLWEHFDIAKPDRSKSHGGFCSRSPRYALNFAVWVSLAQILCVGMKSPSPLPPRPFPPPVPGITNELKFAIYSEVVPVVSICSQRDNSRAKSRWPIFYCARTNLRAIVQSPPRICNFQTAKAAVWLSWNFSHVYPSRKFVLREIDKSSRGTYVCVYVCVRVYRVRVRGQQWITLTTYFIRKDISSEMGQLLKKETSVMNITYNSDILRCMK